MKHFLIVTNQSRDRNLKLSNDIMEQIRALGQKAYLLAVDTPDGYDAALEAFDLPGHAIDYVLVAGGDGTYVRTVRALVPYGVPAIGINLGSMGYLCELEAGSVTAAVKKMIKGQCEIEERMMLEGYLSSEKIGKKPHYALNDLVLHRLNPTHLLRLSVSVNQKYLNTYTADGLIVSSPTGSDTNDSSSDAAASSVLSSAGASSLLSSAGASSFLS